jgi:hypothetical protein
MAPFGWGAWLWLKSNPMAQWALGIGAALIVFRTWLWRRDRRVAKDAQKEIVEQIETVEQQRKEAANEAENRITEQLNSRSLRDVAARSPENLGPVRRDQRD